MAQLPALPSYHHSYQHSYHHSYQHNYQHSYQPATITTITTATATTTIAIKLYGGCLQPSYQHSLQPSVCETTLGYIQILEVCGTLKRFDLGMARNLQVLDERAALRQRGHGRSRQLISTPQCETPQARTAIAQRGDLLDVGIKTLKVGAPGEDVLESSIA